MKFASMMAGCALALLSTAALAQGAANGVTAGGNLPGGFRGANVKDAKPGDIRVITTSAFRIPLDAVADAARKAIGKNIVFEYGSARGNLKDQILAGQEFEVAMLLPDVDEALLKAGKIKPGEHEIARIPIAFGLRGNAKVDVSTPDAIKKTLLAAKSVKYAPTGAALLTVKKVLGDLKIADKVKDNSATADEVKLSGADYEINIYPLSEIIPRKELKNLGPVIAQLQVPSLIMATVGAHANDPKAAMALIKFLQGPTIDPHLGPDGMEKGKAAAH